MDEPFPGSGDDAGASYEAFPAPGPNERGASGDGALFAGLSRDSQASKCFTAVFMTACCLLMLFLIGVFTYNSTPNWNRGDCIVIC